MARDRSGSACHRRIKDGDAAGMTPQAWQAISKRGPKLARGKPCWAWRSLKIDVVQAPSETERRVDVPQSGRRAAVDGYPGQPVADVGAVGWGLALAVGLAGVAMTRRSARKKTAFVLIVAMVATLLPLMIAGIEVAEACNMLFYAACLLVPYYLAAGLVRWAFAWLLPQVGMVRGAWCWPCRWPPARMRSRRLRNRKPRMGRT